MIRIIPRQKITHHKGELRGIIESIIFNRLVNGKDIKKFERKFARYIGVKYAVAVSSGRVALYLILKALKIKKNDEVILSSYNTPIVPHAIIQLGAKPIFVDADRNTLNMDPSQIDKCITKKTKALIVTHVNGYPDNMDKIIRIASKYKLRIVEDCAHAIGSTFNGQTVGTFGIASFFSFGMGKQLNTSGGGMVVTKNRKILSEILKDSTCFKEMNRLTLFTMILRYYLVSLLTQPYIFLILIYPLLLVSYFFKKDIVTDNLEDFGGGKIDLEKTTKFSNVQSKLGILALKTIDNVNNQQVENAQVLNKLLDINIMRQHQIYKAKSIYFHFTILVKNREKVIKKLLKYGIDAQRTWMHSCSNLKMFKKFNKICPLSEEIAKDAVYIPIYPYLDKKDIKYIVNILNKVVIS